MGVFLAYVGQYAYAVDCFATSTAWEYELFATDGALQQDVDGGMLHAFDTAELDRFWPDDSPIDTSLDGWLSPTWKETPQ